MPDYNGSQGVPKLHGQARTCCPALLGSEVLVGDTRGAEMAVRALDLQQVPRAGTWRQVTAVGLLGLQQFGDSLKVLPSSRSRVAHPCLNLGDSHTAAEEPVDLGGAGLVQPADGERRGSMKQAWPAGSHPHDQVSQYSLKLFTQLHVCPYVYSSTSGPRPELFPLPGFSVSQISSRNTPLSQTK